MNNNEYQSCRFLQQGLIHHEGFDQPTGSGRRRKMVERWIDFFLFRHEEDEPLYREQSIAICSEKIGFLDETNKLLTCLGYSSQVEQGRNWGLNDKARRLSIYGQVIDVELTRKTNFISWNNTKHSKVQYTTRYNITAQSAALTRKRNPFGIMVLTREQRMKESGCNDEMRIIGRERKRKEKRWTNENLTRFIVINKSISKNDSWVITPSSTALVDHDVNVVVVFFVCLIWIGQ